ncbi:MAG: hypothetical protein RMY29_009825 [Nostoc sp. CreGUA01]|nr:hypothetical protein [Nostoc sp. CreGUA01]
MSIYRLWSILGWDEGLGIGDEGDEGDEERSMSVGFRRTELLRDEVRDEGVRE